MLNNEGILKICNTELCFDDITLYTFLREQVSYRAILIIYSSQIVLQKLFKILQDFFALFLN